MAGRMRMAMYTVSEESGADAGLSEADDRRATAAAADERGYGGQRDPGELGTGQRCRRGDLPGLDGRRQAGGAASGSGAGGGRSSAAGRAAGGGGRRATGGRQCDGGEGRSEGRGEGGRRRGGELAGDLRRHERRGCEGGLSGALDNTVLAERVLLLHLSVGLSVRDRALLRGEGRVGGDIRAVGRRDFGQRWRCRCKLRRSRRDVLRDEDRWLGGLVRRRAGEAMRRYAVQVAVGDAAAKGAVAAPGGVGHHCHLAARVSFHVVHVQTHWLALVLLDQSVQIVAFLQHSVGSDYVVAVAHQSGDVGGRVRLNVLLNKELQKLVNTACLIAGLSTLLRTSMCHTFSHAPFMLQKRMLMPKRP